VNNEVVNVWIVGYLVVFVAKERFRMDKITHSGIKQKSLDAAYATTIVFAGLHSV
jgi:hypothetical protein